nr:DUF6557 family protein [uncultured Butyrivibrio sp.]
MKTIQQILKELDIEEVIDYYFATYPVDLFKDLGEEWEDMTVAECKTYERHKIKAMIERLVNMTPNPNVEKESVLFVSRIVDDVASRELDVSLVDIDELLETDDVFSISTYAYEFERQEDTLGYYVADTALTQNNLLEVAVSYLYEVSFFGYEQEDLEEERQVLDDAFRDIKEHPENLITKSLEEVYEELGIPIEQTTPEEEEKLDAYQKAGIEYNRYSRGVELNKIKKQIQG